MRTATSIVSASILALLGTGLGWTLASTLREAPSIATTGSVAPADSVDGRALDALQAEVEALRRELRERRLPVARASEVSTELEADAALVALPAIPESDGERERFAALERRIQDEGHDPRFSLSLEDDILNAFDSQGLLPEGGHEVDCGLTLCRIEMVWHREDARDEAMRQLPYTLPWAGAGSGYVDEHHPGRVVVFAAREGYSL